MGECVFILSLFSYLMNNDMQGRDWQKEFLLDPKEYPVSTLVASILPRAIACDLAVGYCFPAGLELLTGTLPNIQRIRILLGKPTEKEEPVLRRPEERRPLLMLRPEEVWTADRELENLFQGLSSELIQDFYDLLASGTLEVRYYEIPSHFFLRFSAFHLAGEKAGEAGISVAIYGTGNFSAPPFPDPLEVNFITTDSEQISRLSAWFDQKWKESMDKQSTLLNLLPALYEKKAGRPIASPAYVYLVDVPERAYAGDPVEIELIWNRLSSLELEVIQNSEVKRLPIEGTVVVSTGGRTQPLPPMSLGTAYLRAKGKCSERRFVYTPFHRITLEERKPEIITARDVFAFLLIFWGGERVGELLRSFAAPPRVHQITGKPWKPIQSDVLFRLQEIQQKHRCGMFLDGSFLSAPAIFAEMFRRLGKESVSPVLVFSHPMTQSQWMEHLSDFSPISYHYADFRQRVPLPAEANRARFIILEEPPGQDWYPVLGRFLSSFQGIPVWLVLSAPFHHPVWHATGPLSLLTSRSPYPAVQKISPADLAGNFFTGTNEDRKNSVSSYDFLLEHLASVVSPSDAATWYPEESQFPQLRFHFHPYEWSEEIPPLLEFVMRYFSEDSIERLTLTALNLLGYKFKKTPEEQQRVKEYPTLFPLLLSRILLRLESGSEALLSMFSAHKRLFESLEAFFRDPRRNVEAVSRALLQAEMDLPRAFTDLVLDTAIRIAEHPSAFSVRKMRADLEWDLKVITELVQKLQTETKSYFTARYALVSSILRDVGGEKCILVSRYPQTIEEIGRNLREDRFPGIGLCSDPFSDPQAVLPRFAPHGFRTSREVLERAGEIQTLLTLDSLPADLPLWDSYALIYLDFPISPYSAWRQIRRMLHPECPHSIIHIHFLVAGKHRNELLDILESCIRRIYTLTKNFRYLDPEWLALREWAQDMESFPLNPLALYRHPSFAESLQIRLRQILRERPGIRLRARRFSNSMPAAFRSSAVPSRTALFFFSSTDFVIASEKGYSVNSPDALAGLDSLSAGGEVEQIPLPEKAVEKARKWLIQHIQQITGEEISPIFQLALLSPDFPL